MKLLLVGDPHMTVESLDEGVKLMDFVYRVAQERHIPYIVILGDLHHTHAAVRVEVTHFWMKQFKRPEAAGKRIILLVGNHDMPGNASGDPLVHALESYKDIPGVTVVDMPKVIDNILYMPYYADPKAFVEDGGDLPGLMFAHQTFTGARYENNFPAADGVDPDSLKATKIISGHIHMRQTLGEGRVVYVGSPRWLISTDANQERGINILDYNDLSLEFVSTAQVCRPIRSYELTPGAENDFAVNPDDRNIVTLKGPKDWINKTVETFRASMPTLEVRSVYQEEQDLEVRESDGLAESLRKFVTSHEWELPAGEVWTQIQARVPWLKN